MRYYWIFTFIILFSFLLSSNKLFAQGNTSNTLSINYSCPNSTTVIFSTTTSSTISDLHWNFGDTASGSLNTSTVAAPTHTFTAPGAYIVTLTAIDQNGETIKQNHSISIIGVKFNILSNLCSSNPNYDVQTLVTGVNSYDIVFKQPWSDNPLYFTWTSSDTLFTPNFLGYFAGYFKITISAANACPVETGFELPTPFPPVTHTTVITPSYCSLNNGAVAVTASGGTPPFTYTWQPNVSTSTAASNLPAGYYSVTVKDKNGCTDNFTATVPSTGANLTHKETIKEPICTPNGSIAVTASGGSPPYAYTWQPAVSTSSSAKQLAAGTYGITVKDKDGCSKQFNVKLQQQPSAHIDVQTNTAAPECGETNGSITLLPSGGTLPYSYAWQAPLMSREVKADSLSAGTYHATVTDAYGCTGEVTTTLYERPLSVSLGKDTFLCAGNSLLLSPGSAYSSYLWNDNSTFPTLVVNTPGTYSVVVSKGENCTAKSSIVVEGGCGDVFFPSAFTPNGDGRNEGFGPVGSLSKVSNYTLSIYNRFGSLLFRSQSPYEKWDGKENGIPTVTGTYVFIASFEINGKNKMEKGTITVLR